MPKISLMIVLPVEITDTPATAFHERTITGACRWRLVLALAPDA